jgi:hypothetical protein
MLLDVVAEIGSHALQRASMCSTKGANDVQGLSGDLRVQAPQEIIPNLITSRLTLLLDGMQTTLTEQPRVHRGAAGTMS